MSLTRGLLLIAAFAIGGSLLAFAAHKPTPRSYQPCTYVPNQ